MSRPPRTRQRDEVAAVRSDYRDAVTGLRHRLGPDWTTWSSPADRSWSWAWSGRLTCHLPDQGWKLHVSTTPERAGQLVREVLPLLEAYDVWWKLPDDLRGVVAMTSGEGGAGQVGKVVTVYPTDDATLAAVVGVLDEAWRPERAPRVPRDLPVGTGGALSLRYGVLLGGTTLVDATGRPASAVRTPDGALVPDDRDVVPDWAPPPPVPTGPVPALPPRVVAVADRRYAVLRRLASRAGATVDAAVDVTGLEVAIVRRAMVGVGADELGRDATARLANEARVLGDLRGEHGTPVVVDHDPDHHVLVTRDVGGRSLEHLEPAEGLRALAAAAARLAGLHAKGLVHRDVKPTNLLWDGRRAFLVDLEVAAAVGEPDPLVGGTAGYLPPGADRGPVETGVDVYALGSCLTSVLLGSCPSRLPRQDNRERQLGLLTSRGLDAGADLVALLTHPEPRRRPTATEAARLLDEATPGLLAELARPRPSPPADPGWARDAARAAARTARAFVDPGDGTGGRPWRNGHHFPAHRMQGVNLGAAGIVLGLTTIEECLGGDDLTADLAADVVAGARWLAALPPYDRAHGLFTGNAGVAVALAVAGTRHAEPDLVRAARGRLEVAAAGGGADPDLFSGAAGVVLAGLQLSAVLDDDGPLDLVADPLGVLRTAALPAVDGPQDAPTAYGAAHGLAGIALALGAWSARTGDEDAGDLADEVLARLAAEVVGPDGAVRGDSGGTATSVGAWCHGLTGHAWVVAQLTAGRVARGPAHRWATAPVLATPVPLGDPTLCHGTAGALETYRLLGAGDRAAEAAAVLRLTHQSTPHGEVWSSEHPGTVTPDLWVGFLGPATQLAMLAADVADPLLSEVWLRRCARRESRPREGRGPGVRRPPPGRV